jgi:hypothetical protein
MRKALMFAALAQLAATPALAATCTGSNARYAMAGADGFSLTLTPRAEPLAWSDLDVVVKTPTRQFRSASRPPTVTPITTPYRKTLPRRPNLMTAGTTHPSASTSSTRKMDVLDLPQSKAPAPDMIFLPDFGGALWYGTEPREFLPIAMWRLQGCG